MNIKKILIAVLQFMLLFSVSCKNEDKTGTGDDKDSVYTNSNHPPAGSYYSGGNTIWPPDTVTHNGDGSCTIAGKAINGSSLEYEITVKSWLNYPNSPNSHLNYVGTSYGGEYTITKPDSSIALDYFDVIYVITNESIWSVSFRTTQDGKYYSSLNLKRGN